MRAECERGAAQPGGVAAGRLARIRWEPSIYAVLNIFTIGDNRGEDWRASFRGVVVSGKRAVWIIKWSRGTQMLEDALSWNPQYFVRQFLSTPGWLRILLKKYLCEQIFCV
jgi:hypothetical protein